MDSKKLATGLAGLALTCIASMPAHALLLSATNLSQAVVDDSSDTRKVTLGAGAITGVEVILEFMKCDDPLSTPLPSACVGTGTAYSDEIVFRLKSPGGTLISLVEEGTYLDEGSVPITVTFSESGADFVGASGFVTEVAKPVQSLALLNGQNAAGEWELFLADTFFEDPLGLFSFTLNVTVRDGDPTGQVPVPATLALFGLGLAGLGALRRRRR